MEGIRDLTGYYQALKKELVCPFPHRKHFLAETQRMVADFRQGNLRATEADVIEFLGDPQELASTFLGSLDSDSLSQYQRNRVRFMRGIAIVSALAFLLLSAWCFYLETKSADFEIVETLTIYESGEKA